MKYLLSTHPNGTMFRIPLEVIVGHLKTKLAVDGDLSISEAHKLAIKAKDEELISFAESLTHEDVIEDATLITSGTYRNFSKGWKDSIKEIRTSDEVEAIILNKTDDND